MEKTGDQKAFKSSVSGRDLLGRKEEERWVESSVRLCGEHCRGQMPGIPLQGDTHLPLQGDTHQRNQRLVFI